MSDLYLIAHKVRGQPAFDVAERMRCPLCVGHGHDLDGVCHECEGEKFWWIVSTSGHRAHPYWWAELSLLSLRDEEHGNSISLDNYPLPPDIPDHYPCNDRRASVPSALASFVKSLYQPRITRR